MFTYPSRPVRLFSYWRQNRLQQWHDPTFQALALVSHKLFFVAFFGPSELHHCLVGHALYATKRERQHKMIFSKEKETENYYLGIKVWILEDFAFSCCKPLAKIHHSVTQFGRRLYSA